MLRFSARIQPIQYSDLLSLPSLLTVDFGSEIAVFMLFSRVNELDLNTRSSRNPTNQQRR
jgi:hypothetical protein